MYDVCLGVSPLLLKRLRGERAGKDLNKERGEKILGSSGGKGLRRKRGEINDLNRELGGGGGDVREERQKIWGKKALGGKGEK